MLSLRNFLFLTLFISTAQAAEIYEPLESVRQLGMGGVYVFNEHDGASFMQNPGYSCFVKGLNWSLVGMEFGAGDLNNYEFLKTKYENNETPSMSNISDFMGKDVYAKVGAFSSITTPCFGTSGYYTGVAEFQVQNPAFPRLDTFYMTEYGFTIGGAIPLGQNLSLGLAAKRISRTGGPYSFGPDSLSALNGSDSALQELVESVQNSGVGYGLDAGLVARADDNMPLHPMASLSWRDVGSTAFVKTKGTDAPERQKDNLILGLTFEQELPLIGIAGGVEYRHITDTDEQISKKIHMGLEASLAMIDWRVGLYQGYYSYGVGVNFWFMQLDAALYQMEKGIYAGQTPERRAQIGLLIDLEFDPNFKLVGSGGKRRSLKQRR